MLGLGVRWTTRLNRAFGQWESTALGSVFFESATPLARGCRFAVSRSVRKHIQVGCEPRGRHASGLGTLIGYHGMRGQWPRFDHDRSLRFPSICIPSSTGSTTRGLAYLSDKSPN